MVVYLLSIYANVNNALTDFWKDHFSSVIYCDNCLYFSSCFPMLQWLPSWLQTVSSHSFGIFTLLKLMFIKYVPFMSLIRVLCELNNPDNVSVTLVVFSLCYHADYPSWDIFCFCLLIWNGLGEIEPTMRRQYLAILWHYIITLTFL